MDFVVVGFGLGALGLLLGLLLRETGVWWWRVRTTPARPSAEVIQRIAYSRACRAGGRTLTIGGAAACGMTLLALLAGLSDRGGASVVVGSLTVIGFAIGAWAIAYAHRYHPRPVRPRPQRAQPIARSVPATDDADAIDDGAIVPVTSAAEDTPTADDAVTAPEPDGTTIEDGPAVRGSPSESTPRTDPDRSPDQSPTDAPISAATAPAVDASDESVVPAGASEASPPAPKQATPSTAHASETANLRERQATVTDTAGDSSSSPPEEKRLDSPAGHAAPSRRGRFDRTLASIGKRD